MSIKKLLILVAAAAAGTWCYKAIHHTESTGEPSAYTSLTGTGSLGETFKSSRSRALEKGPSTPSIGGSGGGIGTIGDSYNALSLGGNTTLGGGGASSWHSQPDDMPLIEAASKGDVAAVQKRLDAHVKIDSRDAQRRTALIYASWNGYTDIITRLLAAGANTSLEDNEGNNVFDYAAGRGLTDIVQLLLQQTHSQDDHHYMEYATIIQAAYAGDPARLPRGRLASVNRLNPEDQSPLHIAAGNGSIALIEALLKRGADANLANTENRTPLHWAAWNNQPATILLLLDHGARLSAIDSAGDTPLILAAQNNSHDAVKTLLAKGADKYIADKQGKTALIIAEDKGYKDIAALLR